MASSSQPSQHHETPDMEEPPMKKLQTVRKLKEVRISKEDRVVALETERVRVASQIDILQGILQGIEEELVSLL